jgi:predicted lipid-binding transport protein (Tim44 family)
MQKILLFLFIGMMTFGLLIQTAEAKRFGGGKSFGYSRSVSNNASRTPSATPAQPASTGNKWLGPLAGLAAGGLLASLFMGHGLGSGMLSWILVIAGAFLLWGFIKRFMASNRSFSTPPAFQTETAPVAPKEHSIPDISSFNPSSQALSNFDENTFLRRAKTVFIRLQAAYDHKDLTDIREFTTPQVFAEIQMQLQERGDAVNQTDVIHIDAQLLDLAIESDKMTASVQFSGSIREEANTAPIDIKEIWHFDKLKHEDNWFIAGIQQT